jgi:hypothetical protein
MSVTDLYSNTLSALTQARLQMLSSDWQAALDKGTSDERLAASRELLQVQQAILALSNESLKDIAGNMGANSTALQAGVTALNSALQDLSNVQNVIQSVSGVLSMVGKIVTLL